MQTQQIPEITPELLGQNPALLAMIILVMMVLFLGFAGSLGSWIWVLYQAASGRPVLPLATPWRPRAWSLIDLAIILACAIAFQTVFVSAAFRLLQLPRDGESIPLEAIAAGGTANLIAVLVAVFWLHLRYRSGASHIGFGPLSWQRLAASLMVGLAGLPVFYGVMILVTSITQIEYDHPLISSASESANLSSYLMACFAAVIAAPIAEEFLFRGVLQGWLQSLPFKTVSDSLIGSSRSPDLQTSPANPSPPAGLETTDQADLAEATGQASFLPLSADVDSPNPRAAPLPDANSTSQLPQSEAPPVEAIPIEFELSNKPETEPAEIRPPFWPSIVAGILFGVAHWGHGMSFIPLSLMGILLGWIYRQTHSVWPCILLHAIFNGFSMFMLGFMIVLKRAAG